MITQPPSWSLSSPLILILTTTLYSKLPNPKSLHKKHSIQQLNANTTTTTNTDKNLHNNNTNNDKQSLNSNSLTSGNSSLIAEIGAIIEKVMEIGERIAGDGGRVGEFCRELMAKSGYVEPQIGIYQLQHIQLQTNSHTITHFSKHPSPKTPNLTYTYLQTPKTLYIFNHAFISKGPQTDTTFILSLLRLECIISYVQLCIRLDRIVRIIMPDCFWSVFCEILRLIFGSNIIQLLSQPTPSPTIILAPPQKSLTFDFQPSSLTFTKNLWSWPSYSLYISINSNKYLIKGPALDDDQTAYAAWRKDVIDEPEYCRLIDKGLRKGVVWQGETDGVSLEGELVGYGSVGDGVWEQFRGCEVWMSVPVQVVEEIYLSGEIGQYMKDQLVYKRMTVLDRFFVVLDGEVMIDSQKKQGKQVQKVLNQGQYWDIQSLWRQEVRGSQSLKIKSQKCLIFSIPLWKIKFMLSHFTQQLQQIHKIPSSIPSSPSSQSSSIPQLHLSHWLKKLIRYNQSQSQNLSSKMSRRIKVRLEENEEIVKVDKEFWVLLCGKSLGFLYRTIWDHLPDSSE